MKVTPDAFRSLVEKYAEEGTRAAALAGFKVGLLPQAVRVLWKKGTHQSKVTGNWRVKLGRVWTTAYCTWNRKSRMLTVTLIIGPDYRLSNNIYGDLRHEIGVHGVLYANGYYTKHHEHMTKFHGGPW